MNRQSLLSLVLASPLGWVIPSSAKAAILPGSQYKHFMEVLDEVADYASESDNSEVLFADDPKRREFGFHVSYVENGMGHSRSWVLWRSEVSRLVEAVPDPLKKILIERALLTPDGRTALAQSIKSESQRLRRLPQELERGPSKGTVPAPRP